MDSCLDFNFDSLFDDDVVNVLELEEIEKLFAIDRRPDRCVVRVSEENGNCQKSLSCNIAVASVMCSGGITLVLGNREEILIWKSIISKIPNGLVLLGSGSIVFSKPIEKIIHSVDRIVSSVMIEAPEAKKIYFCSLMFCAAVRNPFVLEKAFNLTLRLKNFLLVPNVEMNSIEFCHRVYDTKLEPSFIFNCTICYKNCRDDVMETLCCHRLCCQCYFTWKKKVPTCPFCRLKLLPKCIINPTVPTVHDVVDRLMQTRNAREWIVLSRGSQKIDSNPLISAILNTDEPRMTCSKKFTAPHIHDLSLFKGVIYEEDWCKEILLDRIILMMASCTKRSVKVIRLHAKKSYVTL